MDLFLNSSVNMGKEAALMIMIIIMMMMMVIMMIFFGCKILHKQHSRKVYDINKNDFLHGNFAFD